MNGVTIIIMVVNILLLHTNVVSASTCLKLPELCLLQSYWNISYSSDILELDDIICDWQQHSQIQTSLPELNDEEQEPVHVRRFLTHNWIPKCPLHILVNVMHPAAFQPILEMVYHVLQPEDGILFINSCDTPVTPQLTEEAPNFVTGLLRRIFLACKQPPPSHVQWLVVCPECSESSEIIEPHLTLSHLLTISKPDAKETLIPNASMNQTSVKCEIVSQMPECSGLDAIFHIFKSKLNKVSFQLGNPAMNGIDLQELYLDARPTSLILPPEDLLSMTFSNTELFMFPPQTYKVLYCIVNPEFFPPNWTTLLEPLDAYLWIGIFLTVSLTSLYVNILLHDQLSKELLPFAMIEVFQSILSGSRCFSKKIGLVIAVSFAFLVIVNYYLGAVTSAFINIPSRPEFTTVAGMFNNGYRLMITESAMYFSIIPNVHKAIGNKTFQLGPQHFVSRESDSDAVFDEMVKKRACANILVTKSLSDAIISSQFVYGKYKCFFLTTQERIELGLVLLFRHNKAKEGAAIFQGMHASGLLDLWGDRHAWRRIQKAKESKLKFQFGPQSFKALPLRSHIRIVFFLWLSALALAGGVWLVEIGMRYRKRTKVKKFPSKLRLRFNLLKQWPFRIVKYYYRSLRIYIFSPGFYKVQKVEFGMKIYTNKRIQ